ncbi:XdhC family protein [Brucella sp. BE17]|uniref:XdhC family protein n=1 Tax=Brucella sp. BE17 TaxID=3142977 RepID=UPI0031BA0992
MGIKTSQPDLLVQPLLMASQWLKEKRPASVATVIETWGSAPCPVGSHLLVDSAANFYGSVSGGCVETDVITQAMEVIASGFARVLEFGVADETAWRHGLSCGGRIRILITPLTEHYGQIDQALGQRCGSCLVTHAETGAQHLFFEGDDWPQSFSAPLKSALQAGKSGLLPQEAENVFVNFYAPRPRLILIGAVHISQNLLLAAQLTNFDVTILDPRTAFATKERFGEADLHTMWPQDYFADNPIDNHTAVAALTHDPKIDDPALMEAIRKKAFYIGALGSRKTHAKRIDRFYKAGFSQADCALIHAPIGLDIKAQGPAEISIAVLAQIIAAYRNRSSE